MSRTADIENYTYEYEGSEEAGSGECDYEDECVVSPGPCWSQTEKRKSEESSSNSRFASMSKRFKTQEHCDVQIDETLAQNITELFLKGIDDDIYNELVKDETNARPSNCEGLVVGYCVICCKG